MLHKRDFKKELARIVKFLNHNDMESKKLWYVLTALRGPDSNLDNRKYATTSVIRQKIGLNCEGSGKWDDKHSEYVGIGCVINADSEDKRHLRVIEEQSISYHFRKHVGEAFKALDMKWNEVNPPYKEEPKHVK